MRFLYFKKMLPEWLAFFILSVLILHTGRAYLFWQHTDSALRQQYHADIGALFIKGLLFDVKASCVLLAGFVLLGLLALCHQQVMAWLYRWQRMGLTILLCVIVALTVGNVFYYGVYDRQFDVFVFGLWEDDTSAVLKTMWSDYPVVWGSGALLACVWMMSLLFVWIRRKANTWQWCNQSARLFQAVVLIFGIVLALILGIRGSLGKFPLRQSSAQVSPSATLNKLVPNAVMALSWAWHEHRASYRFHEVSDEEGQRLFSVMLNRPVARVDLGVLQDTLPTNPVLEQNKPNVVLAVMESMGTHLLQMDQAQRDLLGRLRPHFQQDWLYSRFVSEGDGTSDTLHRLFIRSPYNNISQTAAKNKIFVTNMFQPYIQAGYRVVYITAGNGGWRNFDFFLKHLGVHEFVDENFLRQRYPEAQSGTWGVPDEYMFRYAQERLQQAQQDKQPVFIMMLSVTHHPPYQLPNPQMRQTFVFSNEELSRLAQMGNPEQINEIFNTFRYANDHLGEFISQSKRIGNTIVAATGDHNMRGIGYPNPTEVVLGHAVPFYLYVPERYRQNAVFQAERVGSHKDVMPTLYALSLSGQSYWRTGCNLTAPNIDDDVWCDYGYNEEVVVLPQGALTLHDGRFYAWQDVARLRLVSQASELTSSAEQGKHYGAFLDWLINRMITQDSPNSTATK